MDGRARSKAGAASAAISHDFPWLRQIWPRFQAGEPAARGKVMEWACEQFRRWASRQLGTFPDVRRREQTDDVLQGATMRLHRALQDLAPESPRHVLGLMGTMIRRELIDLARHYGGPHGPARHHASVAFLLAGADQSDGTAAAAAPDAPDPTPGPLESVEWAEFHRQVDALPDEQREVFNLLRYGNLTLDEVAGLLNMSRSTAGRRLREATIRLSHKLGVAEPG